MEMVLAAVMGVALSAACGFRVFVPLLVAAIAVHTGNIHVTQSFAWIGSDTAVVLFSVATVLEILTYYVPWVDHAMDVVATPAAVVAGTLLTASFITEMSPMFHWTIAVVAGGGAAGAVQLATVGVRAVSTATTAGLGNPIVSTIETAAATSLAIVAILAPIAAILFVAVLAYWVVRRLTRSRRLVAATPVTPSLAHEQSGRVQVTSSVVERVS